MKPAWLTAYLARPRLNAARDRRQALIREERKLDARLALRKAARLEPNAHRRGHITRAINAGAVL